MTVPRLFCRDIQSGSIELETEESHHARNVLRLRRGAPVQLFDGRGTMGAGLVADVRPRRILITVESVSLHPFDLSRRLTLAVAVPKAHRLATLIEKCTELGVAGIVPVLAGRSVVCPSDDAAEKWFRRAVEAARQCERTWVPTIENPATFADSLQRIGEFQSSAIAHPDSAATPWAGWLAARPPDASVLLWIGPEGGWTDEELDACERAGATRVRLAPTILRTETAAMAACAVLSALDPVQSVRMRRG